MTTRTSFFRCSPAFVISTLFAKCQRRPSLIPQINERIKLFSIPVNKLHSLQPNREVNKTLRSTSSSTPVIKRKKFQSFSFNPLRKTLIASSSTYIPSARERLERMLLDDLLLSPPSKLAYITVNGFLMPLMESCFYYLGPWDPGSSRRPPPVTIPAESKVAQKCILEL